ncbi:GNAT family N-acetyltransferase [Xaviernesmea oryzae]|nr:GNAT family N-acetyltransferase [Xaviernesmea oryzae]
MDYSVDVRRLDAFSAEQLYALLKLRIDVFIVEQACIYPELDGKDPQALHLRLLSGGETIAAARIFAPGIMAACVKVGRVLVAPGHRGRGLGRALMHDVLSTCARLFPDQPIALSAQSHLVPFYGTLGFTATSAEYVDAGVPHVDMRREAEG